MRCLTFEKYYAGFDPAHETELDAIGGLLEDFEVFVGGSFGVLDFSRADAVRGAQRMRLDFFLLFVVCHGCDLSQDSRNDVCCSKVKYAAEFQSKRRSVCMYNVGLHVERGLCVRELWNPVQWIRNFLPTSVYVQYISKESRIMIGDLICNLAMLSRHMERVCRDVYFVYLYFVR